MEVKNFSPFVVKGASPWSPNHQLKSNPSQSLSLNHYLRLRLGLNPKLNF